MSTNQLRVVRAIASVAIALAGSACFSTSRAPQDDVLDSVRGGTVRLILTDNRQRDGELLTVDDSSFVILDGRRVVVALRPAVRRIEFGFTTIETPATGMAARDRESLTRRSRFPYRMSAAAMAALLKDAEQREPEVLSASRP